MPRGSRFRLLAHGLLAGALLSGLRVPLGLDWTQVPAAGATSAGLFRAAALLALALSLDASRAVLRGGLGASWLAALALGYALHGFGAPDWLEPSSRTASAFFLLLCTFLLRSLSGPRIGPLEGEAADELGRGERLCLVLLGLGAALALETLAREVRLFTLGSPNAETLLATVFLGLTFVAALSFGPLVARFGRDGLRTPGGLALTSGFCLVGLVFLTRLTPEGLHAYLRSIDQYTPWVRSLDGKLGGVLGLAALPALDGTSIGTLWTTALLASASFIAPAFALGATVGALRNAGRLAYGLVGAGLGLVLEPYLIHSLGRPLTADDLAGTSWSWTLLVGAAALSGLGLLSLSWWQGKGRERWVGSALALGTALLPWASPHLILWSFSPWAVAPIQPELVMPTPEGLVTVERARGGGRIVTLDRRRLTPLSDEEEIDERRLRLAWSLLQDSVRAHEVRGLFVGQLTPARSRVLRSLGSLELERTAPWDGAVSAVEGVLFEGEEPPLGRAIPPAEARAKLARGEYDWVIVPPVQGAVVLWKTEARELWGSAEAPHLENLRLDGDALGVAWVLADSPLGREMPEGEEVVLAMARFEALSVGLVRGRPRSGSPEAPLLFQTGEASRGPSPLELLRTLPQQRPYALEAAWASRLEQANQGGPLADLSRGLALHFGAQQMSSPYEKRAEQIELVEEELGAFRAAVPAAGPLDDFTHELWEGLAWLFTERRLPEEALVYLEPVAERFAPWPALDRALGRAYREVLEPETALRFLERALSQERYDLDLLIECASCARELGDPRRALGFLERARDIQPGRTDLERAYGINLLEAGDEGGRRILEALLARDPEDAELRSILGGRPTDPLQAPSEAPPGEGSAGGSDESGNTSHPRGD